MKKMEALLKKYYLKKRFIVVIRIQNILIQIFSNFLKGLTDYLMLYLKTKSIEPCGLTFFKPRKELNEMKSQIISQLLLVFTTKSRVLLVFLKVLYILLTPGVLKRILRRRLLK